MENRRLLIVDDEKIIRETLQEMLDVFGHQSNCVESGERAIEQVSSNPELYKAVFLDVFMPGMDGIETLKQIRELAPNLPVYIVSGSDQSTVDSEFSKYGISGLLPKPFRIQELMQILETLN